jgi:thiamine-phosphate pyrophosphorylase
VIDSRKPSELLAGRLPTLYPILDSGECAARGLDPQSVAEAFLRAGVRIVQLRVKQGSDADFVAIADRIRELTRAFGAQLIINDRVDVALMCKADGVHVGQGDLPVSEVRRLAGERAIVGISTHDPAQVDEALKTTADYVAVGPVFQTATKATGYEARGLELVSYAAGRGRPIAAIGGITIERAREVVAAGAGLLAVISDLLSGDAEAKTRAFLSALR